MLRSFFTSLVVLLMSTSAFAEPEEVYYTSIKIGTICLGLVGMFMVMISAYKRIQANRKDVGTSFLESRLQPDSFFGVSSAAPKKTFNDTDEVDPIADADVYLAYGRDLQAEEILKEGLSLEKDIHRQGKYLLKLLEIHAKRRSTVDARECFFRIKELTEGVGLQYDEALTIAREIIPGIDKLHSEPPATHTPNVEIKPPSEPVSAEQITSDDPAKSLIGNLEKLTDGWASGEKTITVQTLNSRGNLVTSTIRIITK
jgi:pilus assembly protein FimV